MAIWFIIHDREMITLNEFLFFYRLKPSTHYEYFELSPWDKQIKIVHEFPTSFCDWKSRYFFVSGEFMTSSNDLWGEVSRLLRRWEIPTLGVLFFSSHLYFLFILPVFDSPTFFLICFAAVEQPKLEEQYQGPVEAAPEFVLTLLSEDFKGLVGAHRYECCLGPKPFELVLEKLLSKKGVCSFYFLMTRNFPYTNNL